MELNFTIEVYLSIASVILTSIGGILIFRQNQKNPDTALLFLMLSYFSISAFLLTSTLGYIFLSETIFLAKNIFLVTLSIFITMGMTLMIKGEMVSTQLVIVSFLSAFAVAVFLIPNTVEPMMFDNGDKSLQNIGLNRLVISLLMLYVVFNMLNFSYKIYKHSSSQLRRDSQLFLLGNSIIGILGLGAFITQLSAIIPGTVEFFISLGMFIASIGLIRTPQILYILPFSAIKLSIIKADSGVSFYNYYWNGTLDDAADQLFGAAFLAISNFTQENVGEGGIREIKLEGATMTIKKPENRSVYYVVVATKPSYVLQQGLEKFARKFEEIYSKEVGDAQVFQLGKFQKADVLIPECFPYIPVYS